MKLNVSDDHLKLFFKDLWKDIRRLELKTEKGVQVIRRHSDFAANVAEEVNIIKILKKSVSFNIPNIISSADTSISFQYIAGTRAFNLLMDLRELYRADSTSDYLDLALQLHHCLQDDLKEFQQVAADGRLVSPSTTRYAVGEKLTNVYHLLTDILAIPFQPASLQNIIDCYTQGATVPFRDATTKNVILDINELHRSTFNQRHERLAVVKRMVRSGQLKQELISANIYHIDFTGCLWLCPEMDDWITLHGHEATAWLSDSGMHRPTTDEVLERCTQFVRFSRLGGRKLAYRLLNREGHRIRFGLDSEGYYFETMKETCRFLQDCGILEDSHLAGVMEALAEACQGYPTHDYFHAFSQSKTHCNYYRDVFPN